MVADKYFQKPFRIISDHLYMIGGMVKSASKKMMGTYQGNVGLMFFVSDISIAQDLTCSVVLQSGVAYLSEEYQLLEIHIGSYNSRFIKHYSWLYSSPY